MSPFVKKFSHFTRLTVEEETTLERASSRRVEHFTAREEIVREGMPPGCMRWMLSGWACRYKELANGRRQTVGFFLPGEVCDLNAFIVRQMDHTLVSLTPAVIAKIAQDDFSALIDGHPRLGLAFRRESMAQAAIQREWILNLGQRTARERMAHLLCELFYRLRAAGLAKNFTMSLPLTQTDLAEALGISAVHVNRTLQELRRVGLIILRGKMLTITDMEALEQEAAFDPNYLQLDGCRRMAEQNDSNAQDQIERKARFMAQNRLRNAIAVIRAIIRRTAETSETVEDYSAHLEGRINAFARLLTNFSEEGIDLASLVAEELVSFATHEGERLLLEGPSVCLMGKAAESLGMAVHELATNAVEHGALQSEAGRIAISWQMEPAGGLRLTWIETGLITSEPRRIGFGFTFLERTVAYDLKALVRRESSEGRLAWKFEFPTRTDIVLTDS